MNYVQESHAKCIMVNKISLLYIHIADKVYQLMSLLTSDESTPFDV